MKIAVQQIKLTDSIKVVGKIFHGDYANSHVYIQEVQSELDRHAIPWQRNKVFGIFYDNPQEKKPSDLKSYHGVFTDDMDHIYNTNLSIVELSGDFVYAKIVGSTDSIFKGYQAIFDYLMENKLQLKSSAGYQVSTFDNGTMVTEIYMQC